MTHAQKLMEIECRINNINALKCKPEYNSLSKHTKDKIDSMLVELTNSKFNIIQAMNKVDDSYLWSLMMAQ